MYNHRLRSLYTFGDRVKFNSELQRQAGEGIVVGITFEESGQVDYVIQITGTTVKQPGILETEIESLLGPI